MRIGEFFSGFKKFAIALTIVGALGACAVPPHDDPEALAQYEAANDPFEPANRLIFAFNSMIDQLALQPVTVVYRDVYPPGLKPPFENLITNLFQPIAFIHALLQGNLERADQSAQRFVASLPTLLLGDPFPKQDPVFEDAGQTLGVWGMEAGPYLMLPILGPSNFRDTIGTVGDFFIDPFGLAGTTALAIARGVSKAVIDRQSTLDVSRDLERNSIDYYATVRSLYRQRRAAQILNGEVPSEGPLQSVPTIGLDPDTQPTPQPGGVATINSGT